MIRQERYLPQDQALTWKYDAGSTAQTVFPQLIAIAPVRDKG
jgi:hypothetical protein